MSTSIIKDRKLEIVHSQYELISKVTLLQLAILRKLFAGPFDEELFEEADTNEHVIDRLEIRIREEVAYTIYMFAPKAEDLRRIIAYPDLTTNLERVGDMVMNGVYIARDLDFTSDFMHEYSRRLLQMLDDTTEMIRSAIISFSTMDTEVAHQVIDADDNIDRQQREIIQLITTEGADRVHNEAEIRALLQIHTVAHNLERIGDSATNLAESTIYLVEGTDVRHEFEE